MAKVKSRKAKPAEADAHRIVALGPELRIGNVRALQESLCKALASGGGVILDATGVKSADSAGLQLLYAFVRDSKARGIAVSWQVSEELLHRDADLLGMKQMLGLNGSH